jgi:hypothetical protein
MPPSAPQSALFAAERIRIPRAVRLVSTCLDTLGAEQQPKQYRRACISGLSIKIGLLQYSQ